MNSAEFKKLVTRYFSPKIREMGWKGSGFNFYKIENNHIVNIFSFQGSWTGGSVCCENAIFFDFMKLYHVETIDKISSAHCIIRQRLSPKGDGDYHWKFKAKEEDNVKSISEILDSFTKHGNNFYRSFNNFPDPFDKITVEDLKRDKNYKIYGKYFILNQLQLIWYLKEINKFLGRVQIANEFMAYGKEETNRLYQEQIRKMPKIDDSILKLYMPLFTEY